MNTKMLRVAIASLILTVSGYANAGLIIMNISDNGTDLMMTATGDYDNTGLISQGNINLGANAAVAGTLPVFGWETGSNNLFEATFVGSLTATGNAYPASLTSTTNPFFFANVQNQIAFQINAALIGTVNESATFSGVTLASLGMLAGESVSVTWGQNQAIIQTSSVQVPEPTTLAIFALGIIGLTSRKFKK